MIVIIIQIELENGTAYNCDNVEIAHPSGQLHFDVVDARGKFMEHRAFPTNEIYTIKPKVLTIDL